MWVVEKRAQVATQSCADRGKWICHNKGMMGSPHSPYQASAFRVVFENNYSSQVQPLDFESGLRREHRPLKVGGVAI